MYLFNRSRVARPDTLPSALAWAVDIAGRASSVAGIQVSTWMSMLSQEGGTIVWSAGFDTLSDWEAAFGKLAADADYGAAVAGGGELFTGSVADGLLNVISGMPSEPTDYAYVTAVHATAANGQIGAAMQQGVALAAAATATGGLNTVFGAEVTGQYGGVRWLTGAPSIAAMEESMHAINGDPSFLALVDAGGAVYQPNATQALFRASAERGGGERGCRSAVGALRHPPPTCEHLPVTLPDLLTTFAPLDLGGGFTLRAVDVADAPALAALVRANSAHLGRFIPAVVATIVDDESAVRHCREMQRLQSTGELLEMHLFDGDVLCGSVRMRDVDGRNRSAYIGYFIGTDHQGRGLVTLAVGAFVEWAFSSLQLHRIGLRCVAANTASAAVAHRLGFTLEGRLRDCELIDGVFHDDLVFSRLSSDRVGPH